MHGNLSYQMIDNFVNNFNGRNYYRWYISLSKQAKKVNACKSGRNSILTDNAHRLVYVLR